MIRLFLLVAALLAIVHAWRLGATLNPTTQAPPSLSAASNENDQLLEIPQALRERELSARLREAQGLEPAPLGSEQVELLADSVVSDSSGEQKRKAARKEIKRKVLTIAAVICLYVFIVVFSTPLFILFCVYWVSYGIYVILFY